MKGLEARKEKISKIESVSLWDAVIIGGGAIGAGIAVDAAARGFNVLLLEAQDFAAGTSGRSSDILGGGLKYITNPRGWSQIKPTAAERRILIANAPHLVRKTPFIIPCWKKYKREIYWAGLNLYSALCCGNSIGRAEWVRVEDVIRRLPDVKAVGLKGGVQYMDVEFDDARLNIALIKTAEKLGANVLNFFPVKGFDLDHKGSIKAVKAVDKLTGKEYSIPTRMVFNAAGAWIDSIREMGSPSVRKIMKLSRGSHIIVDKKHFEGHTGMLIPNEKKGPPVFLMPWNDVVVIGTTFVPQKEPNFNPEATEDEINHLVDVTRKHLEFPFDKSYVRSSFAGLRAMPTLLRPGSAGLRRGHSQPVFTEFGYLVTAAGGSWNMYRKTAEAAMTEAVESGLMYKRPCPTEFLSIYRNPRFNPDKIERDLIKGEDVLPEVLEYAQYCKEEEFAITVQDFLFRRLRIGRLSPRITEKILPEVSKLFE